MRSGTRNGSRRTGPIVTGSLASALALAAAACSSSSGAAAPATSSSHHPMASHSAAASAVFGSDCGMIPATGMGSLHGMSMDPVLTAVAHNPLLTTFAADAKTAGLTADLNTMHAITVFAPANDAFSKLPASAMTMMHSTAELAKILKYHVVSGRITPAVIASGKTLTTLEGGTITASKMGAVYEANTADVICGNIQTANATVYIINKVLIPMH
jgi:uncharacterized surface protein with fasciclin (FAS1) repeats